MKIVATSGPWLDALLSFGVQPSAYIPNKITDDGLYTWERSAIHTLLQSGRGTAPRAVRLDDIENEQPDLILLDPYAAADPATSLRAAEIAPTLGHTGPKDGLDSWQSQVHALGQALQRPNDASAIIGDVERSFTELSARFPHVPGRTALMAQINLATGLCQVVSRSTDPAQWAWNRLGFALPTHIIERAGPTIDRLPCNVADLTSDLLWIFSNGATSDEIAAAQPKFRSLPAIRTGAIALTNFETTVSLYNPGPKSLRWALPRLPPLLQSIQTSARQQP